MNAHEVIEGYEALLQASLRMREAARTAQWDELVTLEAARALRFRNLLAEDGGDLGEPALNEGKAALIRAILECDAETRALGEVWMAELGQILASIGTEKKLGDAYTSS